MVTICERSGFMDIVLLSRWQFAITTIYHFLFVPVTLGLTLFLALLETCYVTTKRAHWKEPCRKLLKFFGAIFLVNFAMGVVTGIVQEFHFGERVRIRRQGELCDGRKATVRHKRRGKSRAVLDFRGQGQ